MAKFPDCSGVQSELMNIIRNAERKLLIVSPYLKIFHQFTEPFYSPAPIDL